MAKIVIELSSSCNGTCDICQRHIDPDMKSLLNNNINYDDLVSFLERQKQEDYVLQLSGSLGDPFMYNKIIPFLEYLEEKSNFKEIRFHTNFSFRNKSVLDIIKRMLEKDLLKLWVGMESLVPEIHHIYRGTSLEQILNNIEYLDYKGPNVIIMPIIFFHNENCLDKLKKFSDDNNFTFAPKRSSLYTDRLKEPANKELLTTSLYSKYHCEYGKQNFMILVNGLVVPCCYSLSDLKPNVSIKEYILLGKNKNKLNIKNVGNVEDVHENAYFKVYSQKKAKMCSLCGVLDKDTARDI